MVPATFVIGDLPTSVNGKIDRARLPAPSRCRPELEVALVVPRDELERAVAAIWADVLDIDEVGVLDDFFQLGGDSLRATRVLAGLRARLGVKVGMGDLFASPTVAGIAAQCARRRAGTGQELPGLAADATHRYTPFPLTAGQRAQLAVGGRDYLEWHREWLDTDQFRRAWDTLVARHDALRTVLRHDGSQVVTPPGGGGNVQVTDLRAMDPAEASQASAEVRGRLTAGSSPPRRGEELHELRIVLLPDQAAVIHLAVYRVAADAYSIHNVLLPQPSALYEDPQAPLPAADVTFRDYAVHRAAESGGAVPPSPPGPAAREHQSVLYEAWQWRALVEQAAQAGTTPAAAVLSVLTRVIAEHSEFVLLPPQAARSDVDPRLAAVAGDFTSYQPIPDGGAVTVAVTSLLSQRRLGPSSALGPETHCAFGAPGADIHLLLRLVDGRLHLDWDLPSSGALAAGSLSAAPALRLAAACESAPQGSLCG